jgi:hypothetical protein
MEANDNVGNILRWSRFQREWMRTENRGCFEMKIRIQEYEDTGIDVVNARLNYLADATPKPVNYAYDPSTGVAHRSGKYLAQTVAIRNGRELLGRFSLDTNGFVLIEHETAVKDFYDPEEVESVYYPEVERLIKQLTSAERVVVFDHMVRNPVLAKRRERGARSPAKMVHNDYSFKSAPRRVGDLLPKEADRLLRGRFAEINVWRPIRGPIESSPLALCDARSLGTEDIVPTDLVYGERVHETLGFLYNPKHRWYYFPRMQRNEAIFLKCYDSEDDGRARFTAHTSFEDPNSPPDAAPRESIEARALVFWAPETA